MKLGSSLNLTQLTCMLQNALDKEKDHWEPHCYGSVTNTENEVGPQQRDDVICWLFKLNNRFKLNPETLVLTVTIMDMLLHVVKARPKYLRCIAITSLFLASKILEEDEDRPSVEYLVEASNCKCSSSDILRMEKIILNKLHWDLHHVTALDFLHILHAVLLCFHPSLLTSFHRMTVSLQLTVLTQKLLFCEESCDVASFKPSTRALSLISLELSQFTSKWQALTVMLQHMVQVDDDELYHCRSVINKIMHRRMVGKNDYQFLYRFPSMKSTKRKVEELEEDDIYDSIKRLYGEDGIYDTKLTCSAQVACEENHVILPILTAVGVGP